MDELPKEEMQLILDHIYRGEKLLAIKLYRELRGSDLLEAKRFIEQLESELRERSPQEFAKPASGCSGVLLVTTLTAAIFLYAAFAS